MNRALRPARPLLAVLAIGLCLSATVYAQGKWTKLAPFPEPVEELLGAAAGGNLYVFCGLAPGWKPIGRIYVTGGEGQDAQRMFTFRALEAYDAAANAWTVLPSMPTSRHGLAGAVVGNRLHMVSGDVQSAGSGVQVHSDAHDAFEFEGGAK
jgi:N-acetylneuraminic acid mutarotase